MSWPSLMLWTSTWRTSPGAPRRCFQLRAPLDSEWVIAGRLNGECDPDRVEADALTPDASDAARARLMRVLAHPMRERILGALAGREASPSQLARELDQPLANVNRHVRTLADAGVLELVRRERKGGSVEHIYRRVTAPAFSDADFAAMPHATRTVISENVLGAIAGDLRAALHSGSFDQRTDRMSWRFPLSIDETAWREASAVLHAAAAELERIAARALERRGAGEAADRIEARAAILLFTMPADDEEPPE